MPNVQQFTDWKLKAPLNMDVNYLMPVRTAVSIVIVSYNSRHDLETCLNSVCCTVGLDCEVVVVDNASTDGSAQFVAERFPWVRLIRNERNIGFAAANNRAVEASKGRYVVALNPDTEVETGWLDALLEPMRSEGSRHLRPVGMTTARILRSDKRDRVNACGNTMHYTGITTCRGLDMPADAPELATPCDVAAVSGACFAMTRELWRRLGGLDENYFIYLEDTDLSLRARMAGYRCVYTPDAVVYHSYTGKFSARKLYYLERNRLTMLMKCYEPKTLRAMLPALVLAEAVAWAYALKSGPGHVRAKVRAYKWIARHKDEIRQKHDAAQYRRMSSDAELLDATTSNLDMEQLAGKRIGRWAGAALNPAFRLWRRVMRAVVY